MVGSRLPIAVMCLLPIIHAVLLLVSPFQPWMTPVCFLCVGSRLITAGECLQLWQSPETNSSSDAAEEEEGPGMGGVEFFIEEAEPSSVEWSCLWHSRPANPVYHVKFCPDGLLFATLGKVSFFFILVQ